MSLSPAMDSPVVDEIDSIRMNLNNDFTDIFDEKKDAASETLPVFIRIRPILPQEISLGYSDCLTVLDNCIVRASAPENSAKYRHMDRVQDFTFTHVFQPDVNQLSLFEETMNNAVKGFIEGQNTLLFAYGSSGSGKTYTMLGNEKEPGIIPLTIQLFFQCVQGKQVPYVSFRPLNACEVIQLDPSEIAMQVEEKEKLLLSYNEDMDNTKASCSSIGGFDVTRISDAVLQELSTLPSFAQLENTCRNYLDFQGIYHYSCWVSFMELYNERIYDLFKPFTKKKRQVLPLGEDSDGNIFVKGLKEIHVSSISEVLRLLRLGKRNLNIATTKLNYQSSRSHCIFNIKVIRVLDPKSPSKVFVNTLSFCDLAGSERCGKTQNTGMRLKEASNINASLMVLGRCIEMLRQNQTLKEKKLIPFRESKLTRLFSSFFTGKGKASMIVNVSPSSHTFDETSNVLKFSALAQQVTMKEGTFRQELSRFTDFITSDRLSISSARDSMAEDLDFSNLLDEREAMIKELCDVVENLKEELGNHIAENAKLENRIRSQLKEEYMEYYSETREFYNKRMEELRQNYRKRAERRFKALLQSIRADSVKESSSSEEDDDVDGTVSDNEPSVNQDQTPSSSDNAKNAGTSSMNALEKEILALKTKVEQQEIKLATSGKALDEANIELSSKSKTIEDCNRRISELERNANVMQKKKDESMENVGDLKKDIAEKTEALSAAHSEMSRLKESLSAANTKLESFENLLETNEGLTSQISGLQDKIMEQSDKLAGFENMRATNQGLTSQIAELQEKIMEQAGKLTDHENTIRSLQDKLQSNTGEMKKELLTVEQELCESRNKENTLKANIAARENEVLSKDERILELESISKTLEIQLKEKDETVRKHEIAISNTALDIEKKDGELNGLRKKADTLSTKLQEAQQEVEQLDTRLRREAAASLRQEQRIQELQNQISNAENQLKTAELSVEGASQQTEPMHFEHQILTLEKVRRATEEQLVKTENEVKELQAVLVTKSQEIVTVKEAYEELKSNFESMQLELEDTKQMIESKNEECLSKAADLAKEREKYSELESAVAVKEEQLKLKQEHLTKVQVELLAKVDEVSKNHSELQKSDSLKDKEIKMKEEALKEIQEGLNAKLKDLSKKYSELQESSTLKDKEIKMKEEMLKKVQDDLNGKIEDLNKKYSELQKTATSKDKEIKMKEENLKGSQESLNAKLKDLNKKYSELQEAATLKDMEIKIKEEMLKKVQEELNGEIEDLNKKYSELQKTATSKDKEIKMKDENLKESQESLNEKLKDLSKKYSELQEMASSKDKEIKMKEDAHKKVQEDLNGKIEGLSKKYSELQETATSKDTEIKMKEDTLKKIQADLNGKMEGLSKKCSELQESATSKDKEIKMKEDALKKIQADLNGKIEGLNKQYSELQETATSKDKEIKMKEDTLEKIQADLNEKIEGLNKKYSELQETATSKDNELGTQSELIKELNQKIESLNSAVLEQESNSSKTGEILLQKQKKIENLMQQISQLEAEKEVQSTVETTPKVPSVEIEVQTDQNLEKLLEDKQIETDADIAKSTIALKDQKELEQAERDLCKNEYEIEIEKLRTLKESLEAENKRVKEELKENKKLNEELTKFKEKFENEENKEFVKVEVQPEIEPKPEFLKPRTGRTRRTKISQISNQISTEDLEATSNEENGSLNVKSTRSKRRSSPDIKDTTEHSPPKTKASQRRKKACSLDLSKESLSNGSADSEVSKTDTSENTSPKPKLRGKRKLSQPLEQPTGKESITDDTKPKTEEILEPPPVKSRAVTRKKFSFDQSNNSDADFEPKTKTAKRATRTSSLAVNEEPKKPARSTRVVRKRSAAAAKTIEDEEDKEAPKVKSTRGRLAEQTKKDTIDESPLRRIRNFVSEAVPKIKSAAEHVTSMLSPTVSRKEVVAPVSTQRKGRLFKKDPFLAALSPLEKEEEPVEKKTRGRQPRKTKK